MQPQHPLDILGADNDLLLRTYVINVARLPGRQRAKPKITAAMATLVLAQTMQPHTRRQHKLLVRYLSGRIQTPVFSVVAAVWWYSAAHRAFEALEATQQRVLRMYGSIYIKSPSDVADDWGVFVRSFALNIERLPRVCENDVPPLALLVFKLCSRDTYNTGSVAALSVKLVEERDVFERLGFYVQSVM